jgi:hypothetical protein
MKKVCLGILSAFILTSCASGYKEISPKSLNYASKSIENNVLLEYKYDLLDKKYKKKETKNEVRLISVKITNNTEKDLVFGKDLQLVYEDKSSLSILSTEKLYKELKQSPASYLWYLLLTPTEFNTTSSTSTGQIQKTSSTPIGYVLGPGLTALNMIVSSSANEKFKNELNTYDLTNKIIKKGETVYGLLGINSKGYDAIKVKLQ